jgi:proteasome accessory factor B
MIAAEAGDKRGVSRPPLERMMKIHRSVAAWEYPNSTRLARQLEVSRKSIIRDISFMRDRLNLPIEYDSARYGYYYSSEVSDFPSIQISEGELFALLIAEKALQQYKGTPFEKPLLHTLQKLADSLPDTVSMNLAHWDESISFRTTAEPIVNLEIIDQLARATAARSRIHMKYRKPGSGRAESRKVDPYHLANVDGEWFLFGYCHLRKGIRTFSPLRIHTLDVLDESFPRPDFDVRSQLASSFGVITGDREYHVICRFSDRIADFIREKRWHPTQKLKNLDDGSVELSLKVSNLIEIRSWILSWGGEAEVLQPVELRESIHLSARRILGLNKE